MQITGLTFVGTRTREQQAMSIFVRDVLGLAPEPVEGSAAAFFRLPDGSSFAVSGPDEDEVQERTVGFLVGDVDAAAAELRAAGVETDEVDQAGRYRYVHFRGPDGRLYELVQLLHPERD
jgi:catechol 2,3-dioxygenase-like lactoylglutathione lyase family enzyme